MLSLPSPELLQIIIVFIIYIIAVLVIAIIGKYVTRNLSDYILAGRRLSGPIAALGAGASDMSSWLTMALPGLIYTKGLNKIWMPIGLLIGAWCNWIFVAKRLRVYTEIANNSLTLPSYLHNRFQDHKRILRLVTSLASIMFFTCYAAAGFIAGAILFQDLFGLEYLPALLLSSVIIISYTTIGGFLAVNWIDFFQGSLMFVALLIVPIVTVNNLGGIEPAVTIVHKINHNYLNIFSDLKILGLSSLLVWGLGYFGQPHINVRFMAIRSITELPIARRICMSWTLLSLLGAIATGFFGIAFYGQNNLESPETVFLALSRALFNPWVTGILWSAVLASIMNSVSAYILTTASIVVEDFVHLSGKKIVSDRQCLLIGKIIMIIVSIIAVLLALDQSKTILGSVAFAWSGLGAAFGPTILCSLYWRRMTKHAAICGIIVGMVVVVISQKLLNHPDLGVGFEILPGFLLSTLTIIIVTLYTKAPSKEVLAKFDMMLKQIKN